MVSWNASNEGHESHEGQESQEIVGAAGRYSLYGGPSSAAGPPGGRAAGLAVGSLVGGSLLGAALMYLLDPDAGDRRRHRLVAAGEGAWDSAAEAARHGMEGLTDAASDAYDWAADRTSAGARGARDAWGWGRDRATAARQAAGDWADGGAGHDTSAASVVAVLASGLLCAAAAAGFMFFLDPRSGKRRRAVARDKLGRYGRRAAGVTRKAGENVYYRGRGWVHDARQKVGDLVHGPEPVNDDTLVRRVRAEMGHHTRNAHAIRVSATDGHVLLAGPVSREALDALAAFVRTVHGVRDVECRAETPVTG